MCADDILIQLSHVVILASRYSDLQNDHRPFRKCTVFRTISDASQMSMCRYMLTTLLATGISYIDITDGTLTNKKA
jgi:hypothetical protein